MHVLVDLPEESALSAALGPGDQLVDLSWYQSPLDDWLARVAKDRPRYRLPITSADHFDATVPRFIRWITRVSRELKVGGQPLVEALRYDERLSLWWFNAFAIKHFFKWDLPKHCLRLAWLETHGESDHPGLEALRNAGRIVIWANHRRSCRTLQTALSQLAHCNPNTWVLHGARDEALPLSRKLRARLRVVEDWVRIVRHIILATRFGSSVELGESARSRDVDVAIVTVPPSWVRDESDGQVVLTNRYLQDTRNRLQKAGLNIAMLPACAGGPVIRYFRNLTKGSDAIDWDLFQFSPLSLVKAAFRLARIKLTLDPAVARMKGSPLFEWSGIDLSEWWLFELRGFLGDIAFQSLFLYETLRQSLERLQPSVLLYKDEFYESGRAITLAAPANTRTLPFQHATVFKDHLVYVHDPAIIGPPGAHLTNPHFLPAPDCFLAYGEWVRELMAPGWPKERTAPIGSLRHDQLFEKAPRLNAQADALRVKHQLPDDRPILLIAVQQPAELERWIRQLVGALQADERAAHIVIKMHWQHAVDALSRSVFRDLGWDDFAIFDQHLDELIVASDVMLTSTSTTGLETAVLGTPMICYTHPESYEPFPYVSEGFAPGAWDVESMREALNRVLDPGYLEPWREKADSFVARHLSPSRGHAAEGLVELVRDLLESE